MLSLAVLSFAGAVLTVTAFGAQTYHWQAFDIQISLQPALHGQTRLILTPLGEVRAATHRSPVTLKVSLQSISVDQLKALVLKPPRRAQLEQDLERTAHSTLRRFSLRQIALGALGGLLAPLALRARRLWGWLVSPALGAGFIAALLLATFQTFNAGAFADPTYTGSLRDAPVIVTLSKDAFLQAQALSDKLRLVAANLNTLYGRINAVPGLAGGEDTVRVLHISDIHNNPAAVNFVRELATNFRADAVIDTGDLTDFGLPVEAHLSEGLARLPMPYLFVAGNHDSRATVRAVRAHPNAIILEGRTVTVAGLHILGGPDPSSARAGKGSVDTPLAALDEAAAQLASAVAQSPEPPDIVCVHNPRQAERVVGRVPLVLCGHLHRAYIEVQGPTVICNAGTTGGAGLRYFDRKEGVPLTAALLTFTRPPKPRLLFIDSIALDGSLSQYSISRRTFSDSAASANPPAVSVGNPGPAQRSF